MLLRDDPSTVIPKQFLWAAGLNPKVFLPGSMVCARYRVVDSQIVMDTQMYNMPEMPEELTELAIKYLKLTRFSLHLARPYALIQPKDHESILLLDHPPLNDSGQLLPALEACWEEAPALRQVHWLWQILKLWKPFQEQKVAGSLLWTGKLRVRGPWVQVLELSIDETSPALKDLGEFFTSFIPGAQDGACEGIKNLSLGLSEENWDLPKAVQYVDSLAATISETNPLWIRVASDTDSGPRRDHNEDACYPEPGQPQHESLRNRVVIICDGLGGHEGGEVASSMAIKTLTRLLHTLLQQVESDPEPFSAQVFINQLDKIVRVANDQIVTLNDQQQRTAQQRMGTTLVMAVAPHPQGNPPHEVYVVHVGDSRAYWVNQEGYHQITADDDVATRETVLGYSFASYSAQRIDAGALIQALGTRPSDVLLPRIQRFLMDEDCLFLLCSDGLSDYERVDYIWENHIRTILTKNISLDAACQNLIGQANLLNGHDNTTVGLMRCRFGPIDENQDTEPDREEVITVLQDRIDADELSDLALAIESQAAEEGIPPNPIAPYEMKPIESPLPDRGNFNYPRLFFLLLVLGLVLVGGAWWLQQQNGKGEDPPSPSTDSSIRYLQSRN